MSSPAIRISEIFGPTIQGEGALIGQPSIFVRTGGCDYRCTWCDTLHAVDSAFRQDWKAMSAQEIMDEVSVLSDGKPLMVSLSGGNPAIQPLEELIRKGKKQGYQFALETQGSVAQEWFRELDILTLSPKPPSSGEATDWGMFEACLAAAGDAPETSLKIVVFDEDDYVYARDVADRYSHLPVTLQVGNHKVDGPMDQKGISERYDWLIKRTIQNQWYAVKILPQLHVMHWGNKKGV